MDSLSRQLRTSWPQLGRRPGALASARAFVSHNPHLRLDDAADLCDVVDQCERDSGRTQVEKAEIISALLRDAADPELCQALVVALIPGFHRVAAELAQKFHRSAADSFVPEIITSGFEIIGRWAGQDRAYAGPDILSAARCKVRREAVREITRANLESDSGTPNGVEWAAVEVPPDFYRAALNDFVGTGHDRAARMAIAATYEGSSWSEIAQLEGLSPRSARRETQQFIDTSGVLQLS